jgi:segregation and condensation protein B
MEKKENTTEEIAELENTETQETQKKAVLDEGTIAKLEAQIEAILFTMGDSVEISKIAAALELKTGQVKKIVKGMQKKLEDSSRGIKIIELDGAYQMCTKPEMYEALIKVAKQPRRQVLTDVLMETLSIIAYKQPITKSEIERIRGVKSDFAVNKLVEYQLVEEIGRMDTPGRPLLFGTTEEFLRRFGVESADNLPIVNPEMIEEFKHEAEEEVTLKSND